MRPSSFPVLTRKTVLMQRVLDNLTRGYWYQTSGTVAAARARPLVEKFCERYHVGDASDKRYRRRQRGGGNATLLLMPANDPGVLQWFLLVTEGEHLAHQLESLRDAREKAGRIVLDRYELVQLARPAAKGGGVRWTWRMTDDRIERWRTLIRITARSPAVTGSMPSILRHLFRSPGFGGIRQQVGHLTRFARGELERGNIAGADTMFPRSLGYVRRLKTQAVPLARWCREALKQTPPSEEESTVASPAPRPSATLPDDVACFAQAQVAAGHYASIEEVLRAGLRTLAEQREDVAVIREGV